MTADCQEKSLKRLSVYIDGFNLYHAIAALGKHKLKWINMKTLAGQFLRQDECLASVNFFTAILNWNADKQKRHINYITALRAVGVTVHEGHFKKSRKMCNEYGRNCPFYEEKQTDVSIAISIVADALNDRFDRALLITADSDQLPVAKFFASVPHKKLSLAFPPGRASQARELGAHIQDRREITEGRLANCLLPRTVLDHAGKPVAWMPALYQD